MTWNKGTFPENPVFILFFFKFYFTRILRRIKSQHRVINALHGTYRKIAAVFLYFFFVLFCFFVNSNDMSKIPDGDDASRRDKIFRIQKWGKKCFNTSTIIFSNIFNKLKYLLSIN